MIRQTYTIDVGIPRCVGNFEFFQTGTFQTKIYEILDGCVNKFNDKDGKVFTYSATFDELEDAALSEHELKKYFMSICNKYVDEFKKLIKDLPASVNDVINSFTPGNDEEQLAVIFLARKRTIIWDMMYDLVVRPGDSFDLHVDGFSVDGTKILWEDVLGQINEQISMMDY